LHHGIDLFDLVVGYCNTPPRPVRLPYTVEEVARLAEAGKQNIAVCAPAFSADCIETLEEINEEIKESFEEAGGEDFTYIPCLNDDDAHIDALCNVIDDNLKGWIG